MTDLAPSRPADAPAGRPAVSPRAVRRVVVVIGLGGIAGIIAGSIADNTGLAITSGLIGAIAVGFLILLTAAVGREAFARPDDGADRRPTRFDDQLARDVERRVDRLVAGGADEAELRQLVTRASELGRRAR
jgi:hypothetical protein